MLAKILNKQTIEVYDLTQFDVDAIMHSGQVFRFFVIPEGYRIVVGNNFANVMRVNDIIVIKCNDSRFFWNYFDLDTDYNEIKTTLSCFKVLGNAIESGGGIRILRQPFNETVINFIVSANNNIKRFTKTLNQIAERYGDKMKIGNYAFPTLNKLADVTEQDFKNFGCGYRSLYLVKAIKQIKKINIKDLSRLDDKSLVCALCEISGVGQKVASCVALFSDELHRLSIAPLDTWIKKAFNQISEQDKTSIINHRYAGIAQQYIFYYLQHLRKNLNLFNN